MAGESASSNLRIRPRVSILTALLTMTIFGMAIVLAQLWRELAPLRIEVQHLRDQVGVLTISDAAKIHAISVPTDTEGVWKWRVYVPTGQKAVLLGKWGDIARAGYPNAAHQAALGDGEQIISLTIKKLNPQSDSWIGRIRTPAVTSTISVDAKNYFLSDPSSAMNRRVGGQTETIADDGKLMLMRSRVAPPGQSNVLDKADPLPGFIIWLERK
jgi:hypothetical protein